MARHKQFDREEALDRAMRLFWAKGYEASSISDLLGVMGLNRASLYDTFGDKRALFLAALERYVREVNRANLAILQSDGPAADALRGYFSTLVALSSDEGRLGCMLANTAVEAEALHGSTDDHLVARAFRDMTSNEERLKLLRCLYAVAAADETITTAEDNEIFDIATAIGVSRLDVIAIRSEWKQYLGSMKALPGER